MVKHWANPAYMNQAGLDLVLRRRLWIFGSDGVACAAAAWQDSRTPGRRSCDFLVAGVVIAYADLCDVAPELEEISRHISLALTAHSSGSLEEPFP